MNGLKIQSQFGGTLFPSRFIVMSIILASVGSISWFLIPPLHGHIMTLSACWRNVVSNYTLPAFASILTLILGLVLFVSLKHRNDTLSPLESIYKVLGPDEQRIVEFLGREGGSTTQIELSRLTGFNRVKTHRRVQLLAKKNIVTIEPAGRTNIIKLTKWLKSD